jgi:mannitol/fructose-specific phosphotransferase system IIA component (Ntr-type)
MNLPSHPVDLASLLAPERICFFPGPIDKAEAIERMAALTASAPAVTDPEAFTQAIFEREQVTSTGIGNGVAVPHAKLPSIKGFAIAIGIAAQGIDFGASDGKPVNELIMIGANDQERREYLQILATVAALMKRPDIRERLRTAPDAETVIHILSHG